MPAESATSPTLARYESDRSGAVSGRFPERPRITVSDDIPGYPETDSPAASVPESVHVVAASVAEPVDCRVSVTVIELSVLATAEAMLGRCSSDTAAFETAASTLPAESETVPAAEYDIFRSATLAAKSAPTAIVIVPEFERAETDETACASAPESVQCDAALSELLTCSLNVTSTVRSSVTPAENVGAWPSDSACCSEDVPRFRTPSDTFDWSIVRVPTAPVPAAGPPKTSTCAAAEVWV